MLFGVALRIPFGDSQVLKAKKYPLQKCSGYFLARLEELESPTFGSVDQRSIQLEIIKLKVHT